MKAMEIESKGEGERERATRERKGERERREKERKNKCKRKKNEEVKGNSDQTGDQEREIRKTRTKSSQILTWTCKPLPVARDATLKFAVSRDLGFTARGRRKKGERERRKDRALGGGGKEEGKRERGRERTKDGALG